MQQELLLKKVLLLVVVLHLLELKITSEKLTTDNLDEVTGIQIVSKAIEAPLRTIVENAGGEGSVVLTKS